VNTIRHKMRSTTLLATALAALAGCRELPEPTDGGCLVFPGSGGSTGAGMDASVPPGLADAGSGAVLDASAPSEADASAVDGSTPPVEVDAAPDAPDAADDASDSGPVVEPVDAGEPPAPPPDLTAGQALATTQCKACHGQNLTGTAVIGAPNLTPDTATGLGSWTVSEIVNAVLNGVDDEGTALCSTMPRFASQNMTTTQATNLAAYLKSLAPVTSTVPNSCN
jgi:mono/diheme cytochrome c family protein